MSTNIHFQVLCLAIQAQFDSPDAPPVCMVGPAGAGKNKGGVERAASTLNKELIHVSVPRHDPAEFNGYPYICTETGSMKFYPPHWAVEVALVHTPKKCIVFFDEASDGTRMTQAAMHGLLTDGTVGNVSIKGSAMVMAMNPPNIATTGGTISVPFATRIFQIVWNTDKMDWIRQVMQGSWDTLAAKKLPSGWEKTIPASAAMVGQFLKKFPHLVDISEKDIEARGEDSWKPANVRRTWTHFWTLRAAAHASGQKELCYMLAEGTVGAPGIEYLAWEKDLEFGDPEVWLNNPHAQSFPQDDDRVFAVINAVMGAVLANNTPSRWNKGWEFLEFVRTKNFGDLAALGAPMLAKNRGKAKSLPPAIRNFLPMLQAAGLVGGDE